MKHRARVSKLLKALNKIWEIASEDDKVFGPMADIRSICQEIVTEYEGDNS